jgi:hypothetical protein
MTVTVAVACGEAKSSARSVTVIATATQEGFVASTINEDEFLHAVEGLEASQPNDRELLPSSRDQALLALGWNPLVPEAAAFQVDQVRNYVEHFDEGTRVKQFYYVTDTERDVLLFIQGPIRTLPSAPSNNGTSETIGRFSVTLWSNGTQTWAIFQTGASGTEPIFGYVYGANDDIARVRHFIESLN